MQHQLQKKKHSINFNVSKKKFCLSLCHNRENSFLFVNGTEIYKFKAKDSEIVTTPLCLGFTSEDFSTNGLKKTGLYGLFMILVLLMMQFQLMIY